MGEVLIIANVSCALSTSSPTTIGSSAILEFQTSSSLKIISLLMINFLVVIS